MDISFRDHFRSQWVKYFGKAELPIVFYYTDEPLGCEIVAESKKWSCIICELASVRKGRSLAWDSSSLGCSGAKRYLGFSDTIRPGFDYFLSCGIEGQIEGERYIRTPELVNSLMEKMSGINITGKYIVFKRWDKLEEYDNPDVLIFFASPDVLSGLFTLANFDQDEPDTTVAPFGSGCASIVYHPYIQKDKTRQHTILGMFDVSARPCVAKDLLTFALPIKKFRSMVSYMDESFLITESWKKVSDRLK
jgi:hypothetical protein